MLGRVKIATAGKGGSGKTTIAGTLARALAASGQPVLAVDADLNPNLALTLGLGSGALDDGTPLPHEILEHRSVDGRDTVALAAPLGEIVARYGLAAPAGIQLLLMGKPESAGGG